MFRQFDIDYDKVTIDGTTVKKPDYVNVAEWEDFWNQFTRDEFSKKIQLSFEEGYETRKREEEKEIEGLKDFCYKSFDTISTRFENLIQNPELGTEDKISDLSFHIQEAKDNIWEL